MAEFQQTVSSNNMHPKTVLLYHHLFKLKIYTREKPVMRIDFLRNDSYEITVKEKRDSQYQQ